MAVVLIIYLSLIAAMALGIILYWIYYKSSINKSLHTEIPRKRIPPKNLIIAALSILLIISIGFSISTISLNFSNSQQKSYFYYTAEEERGAIFDPLFDNKNLAEQNGYLLKVWNENGFEVRQLSGGIISNSFIPNNIIRIRYTEDFPTIKDGERIELSFNFLNRQVNEQDREFVGIGANGDYNQLYFSYNFLGNYNIKISAELRIITNKTNVTEPFTTMLLEIEIK